MLKKSEIEALSDKMNFDFRTTKHCLKDVFSKDSTVIDNDIVTKKDAEDFLRICAFSNTKEERKNSFYRSYLPRFTDKDPKKTVVHFIRDYFFAAILAYLDEIEGKRFEQRFEYEELDNENTFYFTMLGTDHMDNIILQDRKNMIIGSLLAQIMDSRDLGSDFNAEFNFVINLSSEIAQDVGYQMFLVDMIRDAFVNSEEMGIFKRGLDKTTYNLMSHGQEKRIDYIFIYCVCESLRAIVQYYIHGR